MLGNENLVQLKERVDGLVKSGTTGAEIWIQLAHDRLDLLMHELRAAESAPKILDLLYEIQVIRQYLGIARKRL